MALHGIGHDRDVQARFSDGVLFISHVYGATMEMILRELVEIVTMTGGTSIVESLQFSTSLLYRISEGVVSYPPLFSADSVPPQCMCKHSELHALQGATKTKTRELKLTIF